MNITGAFALILGAIFSTYVFMPKRRVLAYSLDPNQPGDEFLFNLLIAPVAITVNLVASLPGAVRALLDGQAPQPRPGDDPHRHRGVRGDPRRHAQPVRHDRVVPARQVPGRPVPVRRVPRLDRGLPRDPGAVHVDPARAGPARAGRRRGARRRRPRRPVEHRGACGARPEAEVSARPWRRSCHRADRPDHGAAAAPAHGRAQSPTGRPSPGFAIVLVAASLFGTLGPLSRFAYDAGCSRRRSSRGAARSASSRRRSSSRGGSRAARSA